jgi:hypothetical protein
MAITIEFDWRTFVANSNSYALCRNYISAIAMKVSFRQAAAGGGSGGSRGRQSVSERGAGGLGGAATS